MLCVMSVKELRLGSAIDQYVAIALVVFGFGYLVVGAWPLQTVVDMPWIWQKQIMSFGASFGWMLYALGVVVLLIGVASLYVHSREYHRRHPDLVLE
jgi:xanthine/uracil permease